MGQPETYSFGRSYPNNSIRQVRCSILESLQFLVLLDVSELLLPDGLEARLGCLQEIVVGTRLVWADKFVECLRLREVVIRAPKAEFPRVGV